MMSISFFKLPKEPEWKKLWISKLKRENVPKEENICMCHFHFDSSCFKRDFRGSSIILKIAKLKIIKMQTSKWML